jgi:hypothetical protein
VQPELPQDSRWELRIRALQVNGRRVNEAIERGLASGRAAVFVCECGRIGCNVTIGLSVAQYETSRVDAERFLVAPDHDLPDVDRVVERHDRYLIVAQRRPGRQLNPTDPRQP